MINKIKKMEAEKIPVKQVLKLDGKQFRLLMITQITAAIASSSHYDKLDHSAVTQKARDCVDEIEKQEGY